MQFFNPLDKFYKSQTGAVCADKEITFRVKGNFDSVVLLLKKDGEYPCFYKMDKKIIVNKDRSKIFKYRDYCIYLILKRQPYHLITNMLHITFVSSS